MANLPETATYDAGIYQLETTDPVLGGAGGVANAPATSLANRTKYLKAQTDALNIALPAEVSRAEAAEALIVSNLAGTGGAALVGTSDAGYSTVQDELSALNTLARTLAGTTGQITITASGDGSTLTFSLPQSITTTSDVQFRDTTVRKSVSSMNAPLSASATLGSGSGTGATLTITGNGKVFQLSLVTGTSPSALANVMQIVFFGTNPVFAATPQVTLIPANRQAWANAATSAACIVASTNANGFSISVGGTALTASATYVWTVLVDGI